MTGLPSGADLGRHPDRWVAEGLIDAAQATRLEAAEAAWAGQVPARVTAVPAAAPRPGLLAEPQAPEEAPATLPSSASYVPNPIYQWNSQHPFAAVNTITHTGEGCYTVLLPDLGAFSGAHNTRRVSNPGRFNPGRHLSIADGSMDISCQSRSPAASVRFIGVLAAVIVIAAGCGSSAGHGHPAVTAGTTAAVTPDPCTALPAADVARIAHLAAAATVTLRGRGLCEYGAAESGNGVIIGVGPYSRAQFDAGLRSARSRGARCIDLRIGEAAYGCGPSSSYEVVNVYADGLVFSVQVTRAGPDQSAETRALAQFAVSRY